MPMRTRVSSCGVGVLLCLLSLLGDPGRRNARAQSLGRIDRDRGVTMLQLVREDVEKHYYDAAFRGVDLAARFDEAEHRIRQASTVAELLGSIADVLFALDDSHTFFVPPGLTYQVDYGWEMQFFGDSCFVSEVRPESDAQRQGVRAGDLVLAVNGIRPSRDNLWKFEYVYHLLRPQRALQLVVQPPGGGQRQLDVQARVRQHYQILDLTRGDGISQLIRDAEDQARRNRPRYVEFGSDLLVWKLPSFSMDLVSDGVKRLKGRSAVILDLRDNGGGSEAALLELVGRFFGQDVAVGTLRERSTKEALVAKGRGERAYAGQLLVLVDSRSASAAEVFARIMQLNGRARVVGDRTAGAVMRSRAFPHTSGREVVFAYATSVTDADLLLPDGSRLEKDGLAPDVPLVPSSADLAGKRDPVLAHAAQLLGVTVTPEKAWTLLHAD